MTEVNIPIWPGSSSFVSQSKPTPFAFYDNDTEFARDADKVADYCARRLGYPVMDVELQDIQFFACFEEAVVTYSNTVSAYKIKDNLMSLQGASSAQNMTGKLPNNGLSRQIQISKYYGTEANVGGNIPMYKGSFQTVKGQQTYDLNAWAVSQSISSSIEIRRVFHDLTPAIVRYFDPFIGTGMGMQQTLELFGWGSYSPAVSFLMMPVYADILRIQSIEFNDQIRKSAFSFEINNNKLRLFPIPQTVYNVYFDYYLMDDKNNPFLGMPSGSIVTDYSNVPYDNVAYANINDTGRSWIYRYTLASAKEILGFVRGKYQTIPIPNAETTLNGSDLTIQSQTEKENLMTELKEMLDSLTRAGMMEREQAVAEALQYQLNKVPLAIYVGTLVPFLFIMFL